MNRTILFCLALSCSAAAQSRYCADCPSPTGDAWTELDNGNQRFACNQAQPCTDAPRRNRCRRECTAKEQKPFALILSCSDSRVPPEILFDQGISDLFIFRVAGNIATTEAKGSFEYALAKFRDPYPKLLLVLGHDDCGAVKTAIKPPQPPPSRELRSIYEPIIPAVGACRSDDCATAVADRNVQMVVCQLKKFPPVEKAMRTEGLQVKGARYNVATGRVALVADIPCP